MSRPDADAPAETPTPERPGPGTAGPGPAAAEPRPGTVAARRAAAARGPVTAPVRGAGATRGRTRPSTPPATNRSRRRVLTQAPVAPAALPPDRGRDETTEFLLQSLRDLAREHDAGDLSDEDYAALRDDYTTRAAAALRAEQRGTAPPPPVKRRRSPAQWALIGAAIVGFAVLAGVLMAQASGERGTGEGITGEVVETPTQAAGECIELTARQQQSGDVGTEEVLGCYERVLDEDPQNAVARTYLGWTLYITAQQAEQVLDQDQLAELYIQAHRQLDLAVEADPAYADARAFQVVLAANEGRDADAAEHLAAFDALDAPADMAALVEPVREEIEARTGADTSTTTASTTAPG